MLKMPQEQIIEGNEINYSLILPLQQEGSMASGIMSQLGGGLGGLASGFLGISTPVDQWLAILKSETIYSHIQSLVKSELI